MSEQIRKAPAAKAVKPAKKLVPRTAPKAATEPAATLVKTVVAPAAEPKASVAKPVRKATKVEETVAKNRKVLADALVQAQAINYDKPKLAKPVAAKPAKAKKVKLVRDSYAMPESEYAQIGTLKKRLATLGCAVKKSELLRGGIAVLAALNDAELQAVMARVERIKTGRPAK